MLGPTRVVVPTHDFANGVAWLELSESLEAMPAKLIPPMCVFAYPRVRGQGGFTFAPTGATRQ
jgi:hypothetical protein